MTRGFFGGIRAAHDNVTTGGLSLCCGYMIGSCPIPGIEEAVFNFWYKIDCSAPKVGCVATSRRGTNCDVCFVRRKIDQLK